MARPVARPPRAAAAALPQWVRPQLTKLVERPPEGPAWLHELKFDGYRMHARLDRGAVRLLTRTELDWTHKYPAIARAVTLGLREEPSASKSLDHLVGAQQHSLRDRQPEFLGGLQIDHQLEPRRLVDR